MGKAERTIGDHFSPGFTSVPAHNRAQQHTEEPTEDSSDTNETDRPWQRPRDEIDGRSWITENRRPQIEIEEQTLEIVDVLAEK